ncbi:uncharacterized protein RHOBADRAFT_54669 [Rhodotorula graminis WP1]|uniref:RlpA-like protein double-psi beta-barrel domain-containing protein n=1 Tax=Rhodotorula graminis (strain WP1) TaxID=578459 RepID=A0A0P9EPB5_RHOGW|nr:uncharacterized protein RHOBADRAFT_54669 [Rhodotorula graminis WP1]KPV74110.1 hypothetical protein RHOBADRAFT_54669 [Rhodotorula graminis WP1]
MRTSLTLAALGASAALAPTALALSYQTGHFKRSNHPAFAERALAEAAAAAQVDKRAEPAVNQSSGLAKRQRFERKVRRGESSSSSAKSAVYESTAIWWATTGWAATCGENTSDDAMILGLPLAVYPDISAASPLCGTPVTVTAKSTGKQITASVIGASNRDDYTTFSKAAYLALGGDLDVGMLDIEFSLGDETAAEVVQSASASKASVSSHNVASSSAAPAPVDSSSSSSSASSSPAAEAADNVEQDKPSSSSAASPAARVPASTTSAQPTTTAAPNTSARPTTTQPAMTTSAWDSDGYSSSSSAAAAAAKSKADAEWAASSSSSAEAYQMWASSSSAAAASKASADAAWAASSSSSAAAAASSKAAADAAWAASSSSSAAAAAKETSSSDSGSSSGGSGKVYSGGIATFFYQHGVAGNCGNVNSDSTLLVALPTNTYAGGSHCGQYVQITRTATGQSIKALVADSCPTCNNDSCLDLSWGAFSALGGTESMGVFDITWQFV